MSQPRIEMNAVILPTGDVLALGGSSHDEDASTASLNADLYDPGSNHFSSAGANAYPRLIIRSRYFCRTRRFGSPAVIRCEEVGNHTWRFTARPICIPGTEITTWCRRPARPSECSVEYCMGWTVLGFDAGRGQHFPSRAGAAGCVYSRVRYGPTPGRDVIHGGIGISDSHRAT